MDLEKNGTRRNFPWKEAPAPRYGGPETGEATPGGKGRHIEKTGYSRKQTTEERRRGMMARHTRQISLLLTAAMLAAVFGGCRPAAGNETPGTPETPVSSEAAASGQDTSQSESPGATRGPCPDYDQAMADATGAGYPDSAWQSMGR